jgi:regulator of sirC expression with transglutaminase-like and TPR domain
VDSGRPSEVALRLRPLADALAADAGLDELALGVSAALRPGLDLIGTLALLDELSAGCPTPTRDGVIAHLFGSGMFGPDRHDYHSWRNSCLDEVLARRVGMPITLSIVAIEVARRVGVRLVGVGLPGHFVVGDAADRAWFADPYHGRGGLTPADCRSLVGRMGASRWSDRFLDPTPDRLIVARVLNNLRSVCERRGDRVRLAIVMQARQLFGEFAEEQAAATRALAALN